MNPKQKELFVLFEKKYPNQYPELKTALLSGGVPGLYAQEAIEELLFADIETVRQSSNKSLSKSAELHKITFTAKEKGIIDKIKMGADDLDIVVYLAGGIVRDRLLGRESQDLDFVAEKDAEKLVQHLMKKFNLSGAIKYSRSRAISITIDDTSVDIINAEKIFTPVVSLEGPEEFSISFDDVYRRDLTINSLLYDIRKNEVVDYTGKGLKDLEEGRIQTIIDPHAKYKVHATDILRALRFSVTLGFTIDEEMKDAMRKNAFRVKPRDKGGDISNRRIRRELRKTVDTPEYWDKMKELLADVGLFDILKDDILDVEQDMKGEIEYEYPE